MIKGNATATKISQLRLGEQYSSGWFEKLHLFPSDGVRVEKRMHQASSSIGHHV